MCVILSAIYRAFSSSNDPPLSLPVLKVTGEGGGSGGVGVCLSKDGALRGY